MKILLTFFLCLLFTSFLYASPLEEEILYDSSYIPLRSIKIISKNLTIGVGEQGLICKLTDSCRHRTFMILPEKQNLNKICSISDKIWICIGDGGLIYRTSDAGNNWQKSKTNISNSLNTIKFINENIGVCVGNGGAILRTIDGGKNWDKINCFTTENLLDITSSSKDFYVVGNNGTLIKSTDYGATWSKLKIESTDNLQYIYTSEEGIIYIFGNFPNLFISDDKCQTFIKSNIEPDIETIGFKPDISAYGFFGLDSGFVKVLDQNSCNYREVEYFTTNSGMSWTRINRSAEINVVKPSDISCYDFLSSNYGVVCDIFNGFYSAKFEMPKIKFESLNKIYNIQLNNIKKINNQFLLSYEIGTPIGFYKSSDKGNTWIKSPILDITCKDGGYVDYIDMEVPEEDLIYLAINSNKRHFDGTSYYTTQNSVFMKTTDFGATWSDYYFNNNIGINNIEFATKDYGMVYCWKIGERKYYLTSDGGTTWKNGPVPNIKYLDYWNIKVFSPKHIFMTLLTKDSTIIIANTTDEGITWKFSNVIPNKSNRIIYFDEDNFLVYNNSSNSESTDFIIYRTSDRGMTWGSQLIYKPFEYKEIIHEIHPFNEKIMLGIDLDDKFYITSDSWNSFQIYQSGFEFLYPDVLYTSQTNLLINGIHGKLISLTFDNVSVPEVSNTIINNCIYPNPATDYIEVNVGANGRSPLQEDGLSGEIKIFDILGNEMHPPRPSGTPQEGNKYRIDVSTLPAGVYFVRIGEKVEKFVKM